MKTAWLCIWFAFAAAEVGLTLWSHSATFLEIGIVVPLMIAFNLQRVRPRARARVIHPQVVIG
ncbi:MAG TPA: hypothetical protein VK819_01020 [Acidobacteriaceae bacterium]|jgi:hypothetical protein|nr:hypothetical protein [Acidobacteriaceae bacterium]